MAAPVLVNQTTGVWSSGNSISVTIPATTTGNTIVVLGGAPNATPSATGVTLTGATFTRAGQSNTNRMADIWRAPNVTGGGTALVVNFASTPSAGYSVIVLEFSGLGATVTDDSATATSGNSTAMASASVTPTSGYIAVALAVARAGGAISAGPTNSWTATTNVDTRTRAAYLLIASTSGSYATDWTVGSGTWDCEIVVLRGSSAGGGGGGSTPQVAILLALGLL